MNQEVIASLNSDEVDMLTTLRMNRDFTTFMRYSHAHLPLMNFEDFIEDKEESQSLNINAL